MVDAWGGWSLFQELLRTLKTVASKHGVSIPTVAVRYILDQVITFTSSRFPLYAPQEILFYLFFLLFKCDAFCLYSLATLQQAVAGSMVGVRLGLSEHIKDVNAIFSLVLDEDDLSSILKVSKKGKDLMKIIGDCGDEYRRA